MKASQMRVGRAIFSVQRDQDNRKRREDPKITFSLMSNSCLEQLIEGRGRGLQLQ
jgi:hypothetical protein